MSVKMIATVWEQCQQTGNALLLMLALADHADDSGRAWPGIERLAHKVRVTERTIYSLLKKLEAAGDITIQHGGGRHQVNQYQITLKNFQRNTFTEKVSLKVTTENPEASFTKTLKPASPDPSVNRQVPRERTTPAAQATSPTPTTEPPKKTATRIPHQDLPTDWRQYCQQQRPDLDPDQVWENFRDYWLAAPGQRGRKQDWSACWRTWVRREAHRSPTPTPQPAPDRFPIRMPHVLWMTAQKRTRASPDPVLDLITHVERQTYMTAAQHEQLCAAGMERG